MVGFSRGAREEEDEEEKKYFKLEKESAAAKAFGAGGEDELLSPKEVIENLPSILIESELDGEEASWI